MSRPKRRGTIDRTQPNYRAQLEFSDPDEEAGTPDDAFHRPVPPSTPHRSPQPRRNSMQPKAKATSKAAKRHHKTNTRPKHRSRMRVVLIYHFRANRFFKGEKTMGISPL